MNWAGYGNEFGIEAFSDLNLLLLKKKDKQQPQKQWLQH